MSLSADEKKFLEYWEANRLREKQLTTQLMYGLPMGILFAVPIIVNFLLGRFWYKRADAVGMSQFNPTVLLVAVLLIAVFIALINRRFRWEKLEQQYLEIKAKDMLP
jgi:membrane protein YdbS with pleckstrin-like domain